MAESRHRHTHYFRWSLPPPSAGSAGRNPQLSKGAVYESDRRIMDKLSLAAAQYYKHEVLPEHKEQLMGLLARES